MSVTELSLLDATGSNVRHLIFQLRCKYQSITTRFARGKNEMNDQDRIGELESVVARLREDAIRADETLAILLGTVAEASGVRLNLDAALDEARNDAWLESILQKLSEGRETIAKGRG